MRATPLILVLSLPALLICGCSSRGMHAPSLAPRAAETVDPRLPVERTLTSKPADSALRQKLAALIGQAQQGDVAFRAALGPAERAANAAGAPRSEGWIAAQEALSALEAARAPTAQAMSAVDALAGDRLHAAGDIGASDQAAIADASASIRAIDDRQTARIRALNARLGR